MQSPSHDEALLSLRWCYTRGPTGTRWTRWQWALGSVAVGAPADEINIVPTRRTDSAGASSMIESDSISVVSDAARGDKTSA
jgi:hypothetical protein